MIFKAEPRGSVASLSRTIQKKVNLGAQIPDEFQLLR